MLCNTVSSINMCKKLNLVFEGMVLIIDKDLVPATDIEKVFRRCHTGYLFMNLFMNMNFFKFEVEREKVRQRSSFSFLGLPSELHALSASLDENSRA